MRLTAVRRDVLCRPPRWEPALVARAGASAAVRVQALDALGGGADGLAGLMHGRQQVARGPGRRLRAVEGEGPPSISRLAGLGPWARSAAWPSDWDRTE